MKTNSGFLKMGMLFLLAGLFALTACSGGEQTITGTVEKNDQGLVLKSSDGDYVYRLVENQDLSAMIGKRVEVSGTLLERVAGQSILVTRFEVIGEVEADSEQTPMSDD